MKHRDEIERLACEHYSPVLFGIRKDRKPPLRFDYVVSWHVINVGSILNPVACKALLLKVVVGRRHVDDRVRKN